MCPFINTGNLLFPVQPQTYTELYSKIQSALADEMLFTEIRINGNRSRYYLHPIWRKLASNQVVDFLESHEIDLTLENEVFSIAKIWKAWPMINPDFLDEVPLAQYFRKTSNHEGTDHLVLWIEKFKGMEDQLLKGVMNEYDTDSSFYQPIPIPNQEGFLDRMVYLVYDKSKLSPEATEALSEFQSVIKTLAR